MRTEQEEWQYWQRITREMDRKDQRQRLKVMLMWARAYRDGSEERIVSGIRLTGNPDGVVLLESVLEEMQVERATDKLTHR